MITIVFYIILIYFLIGAVAVTVINKKSDTVAAKDRWMKYFVYLIIVFAMILSINYTGFMILVSAMLVIALYEMIRVWKKATILSNIKPLIGIISFLVLAAGFVQFAVVESNNEQLFVYTLVFTFDGFSQIIGQLMGKRKPFVRISPNKTIEGTTGGLIFCAITSVLLKQYMSFSVLKAVEWSLCISIAALIGDLAASYYKRICKVKDYSQLIPGHGGILDRFDSFIAAGTVYWIITRFNF